MTFTRFVEAGRVVLVNYGEHLNKLVVIVDILDQSRLLVEGPTSGVRRQIINVKRVALTAIKLEGVKRGAPSEEVKCAYEAANVDATFAASGWGKKLARKQKRAQLDDFGRFKVVVARMKKSKIISEQMGKMKA